MLFMLMSIPAWMVCSLVGWFKFCRWMNIGGHEELVVFFVGAVLCLVWSLSLWPLSSLYVCKSIKLWEPHCRKCGYNLKVMTDDTCPECGMVYDPDYQPLMTRHVCQFDLTRQAIKRCLVWTGVLFVILSLLNGFYSMVTDQAVRAIGYPATYFSSGHLDGQVVQDFSLGLMLWDMLICLVIAWLVQTVCYNIQLRKHAGVADMKR
ncbi:MAG: hypothetical protein ACF8OB_03090 [Phycisphaeraceae bacterium JB051]